MHFSFFCGTNKRKNERAAFFLVLLLLILRLLPLCISFEFNTNGNGGEYECKQVTCNQLKTLTQPTHSHNTKEIHSKLRKHLFICYHYFSSSCGIQRVIKTLYTDGNKEERTGEKKKL